MADLSSIVYLDYNATTPVAPAVLQKMLPYFGNSYGNPASRDHVHGWLAQEAIDEARREVAQAIGAQPEEITFTSGATESINLLIKGLPPTHSSNHLPIVTLKSEHKAVLETCHAVEKTGRRVVYLDVDAGGQVDLFAWKKALQAGAMLACVLWVNNETGVLQNLAALDKLCQQYHVPLFVDASQALGKIPVNLNEFPAIQYACFSAHKIYGPKGIGALYLRKGSTKPKSLLVGGGQERGLRSGTLNVPGIVGFGAAAHLVTTFTQPTVLTDIAALRDQLEEGLMSLGGVQINGSTLNRVPHVSNLLFAGIPAEELIMAVNHRLAISTGSACNSLRVTPSHVLLAMGRTATEAYSSLRFSLGRMTTALEVQTALQVLKEAIKSLG